MESLEQIGVAIRRGLPNSSRELGSRPQVGRLPDSKKARERTRGPLWSSGLSAELVVQDELVAVEQGPENVLVVARHESVRVTGGLAAGPEGAHLRVAEDVVDLL